MTFWLRSKCSICSIIFGTVKVVGCISCTVYRYYIVRNLTPNNEVFGILSLSLGFPIVGEVELVPQTQQSGCKVWLQWFHGSAITWLRKPADSAFQQTGRTRYFADILARFNRGDCKAIFAPIPTLSKARVSSKFIFCFVSHYAPLAVRNVL